jgi:hypothetical protein
MGIPVVVLNGAVLERGSKVFLDSIRLLKKCFLSGYSKIPRCKAPKTLRSETYLDVRRNDEG